ncbi:MAG: Hcp family type VI secretion system effector [Acidimicrobiales bacterium]
MAVAVVLMTVGLGLTTSVRHGAAGAAGTPGPILVPGTIATMVISGVGGQAGGIPGNGSAGGHGASSIELLSWSWGATNSGSASIHSGRGGKVSVSDITITKSVDKATPLLFQACVSHERLGNVLMYFDVPGATGATTTYLTITLTNVIVTRWTNSSNTSGGGEENPTESISLNFTKVTMDWSGTPGSTVHAGYDLALNKKV